MLLARNFMHLILKHLHLADVQGAELAREKLPSETQFRCLFKQCRQSQLKALMRLSPVERVQKQITGSGGG